jgi:hypothetical protein
MRRQILSLLVQVLLLSSFAVALSAGAYALTETGSIPTPFAVVPGDSSFAVWSGGAFIAVEDRFSGAPTFQLFDRNGREFSQFTFTIPGANSLKIWDNSMARGPEGSLVITGTLYWDDSGYGSFVAWLSADRQQRTVIRTSSFRPEAVTLASDGTIWVAGHVPRASRSDEWDYSQHLIRHYDNTGKLLGSFIPWSSLEKDKTFATPTVESVLRSFNDRVGWYSPGAHTYIEFSLDGSVLNRFKAAPNSRDDVITVAACDDGSVFAATQGANHQNFGIFVLDRQQGDWTLIPRKERWGDLLGCDGTQLVAVTASDFRTIRWLQPAWK